MSRKAKITAALTKTRSGKPSGLLLNWADDDNLTVTMPNVEKFELLQEESSKNNVFVISIGNCSVFGKDLRLTTYNTIDIMDNKKVVGIIYLEKFW